MIENKVYTYYEKNFESKIKPLLENIINNDICYYKDYTYYDLMNISSELLLEEYDKSKKYIKKGKESQFNFKLIEPILFSFNRKTIDSCIDFSSEDCICEKKTFGFGYKHNGKICQCEKESFINHLINITEEETYNIDHVNFLNYMNEKLKN